MKTKSFLIGAFALVLVLVGTGANAYVGNAGETPSVADFNWVNNIGTLTWTTGEGTINIDVTVIAPETFSGSYSAYKSPSFTGQYDTPGTSGTFDSSHALPGSTFDSCYGYYYTLSLTGYTGSLDSFGFNMGPATITEIGYDKAYAPLAAWEIASDNTLKFIFPNFGDDKFTTGETASAYVASEYWWGWSNAIFEDNVQTSGGAYNGKLPAPNPEAPTVALFMLGIFGLHVWRNKGLRFMANSQ